MSRIALQALRAQSRSLPSHLSNSLSSTSLAICTATKHSTAKLCSKWPSYRPSYLRLYATDSTKGKKAAANKSTSLEKPAKKTTRTTGKKKTATKKKSSKRTSKKKPLRKRKTKRLDELTRKVMKVKELKARALVKEPKLLPVSPWIVFTTENAERRGDEKLSDVMKSAAAKYRRLSSTEQAAYRDTARQNKEANEKTIAQWISSHTPDQIRDANHARRSLNRMSKEPVPTGRKLPLVPRQHKMLKDPRHVKRADTPYIAFARERWASGDFKGIPPTEAMKQISMEYKDLGFSQLKALRDRYEQDRAKYIEEFNRVFTTKAGTRPNRAST